MVIRSSFWRGSQYRGKGGWIIFVQMQPISPPTAREYNLDEIRFIREEVKFQHTLIGTRISWFVSAQAFLVTPFAICLANQLSRTFLLALVGIPFLGITLSLLIVPGIQQIGRASC